MESNKSLRQRIIEVFRPSKKAYNPWGSFGASSYTSHATEHQIITLINDCNKSLKKNKAETVAGDPRPKLAVYRAIAWAFPFVDRAISIHADFMGAPRIETDNDQLKARIKKFWTDFKISGEMKSEFDTDRTMQLFARELLKSTLRDGLQPYEIEGKGKMVDGARLFDAAQYDFVKDDKKDIYNLIRINGDGQGKNKIVRNTDRFNLCKLNRSTRFLWGLPLIYNAEFYAEMLLRVMIARRDSHIRLGNPPSITTVGYDLPKDIMDKDLQAKILTDVKDRVKDTIDGYKSALARMYHTGRPEDMVLMTPGGLRIDSKMFGQGAPGIQGYPDEYELYALQIALTTDVPVEFLGIRGASAGLGSDFFRVMKEILNTRKTYHQHVIGTHIKAITDEFLIGESVAPGQIEGYEIAWSEPDISDEKLIADTEKVEAETFALQSANYADLLLNIGRNEANVYAEQIGRPEWVR
ncbi:MAG: hypothetical protein GWN62_16950 [Aliifodinibius sp.]|nr:hypothetical protein [Fodinibius sp.]